MLPLTGYTDRLSVSQGQTIAFKLSSETTSDYTARLVRVISGDPNPAGPGIVEEDLSSVFSTKGTSAHQPIRLGSFAEVEIDSNSFAHCYDSDVISFHCRIWPTLVSADRQCIASLWNDSTDSGIALFVHQSHLMLEVRSADKVVATIKSTSKLRERVWSDIGLSLDFSNAKVRSTHTSHSPNLENSDSGSFEDTIEALVSLDAPTHIRFAAVQGHDHFDRFNGKLEAPQFWQGFESGAIDPPTDSTNVLASWDFARGIDSQTVFDAGPSAMHGKLQQLPSRAMRGSNWDGREHCWRHAPDHYGAIHFHDDDIYDCEWSTDFEFAVPENLKSGVYAMRITSEHGEEMLPFFVRPKPGTSKARIVYLAPTFTYTVYGNHARGNTDSTYKARAEAWGARPWTPDEHREYGFSTYNFHRDGSGIGFASRLRPMITMRSGYLTFPEEYTKSGLRHFPADTHLLSWLEHEKFDFDVVSDEDLHAEGVELLRGYDVIVTSSHPEYHTPETRQALSEFTSTGGRMMYLGGNGFYWRVAVHSDVPGAVEIRRAETGIRAWAAEPGEYYHALDGGYGGTWRRNNKPPQQLAGVGFSGQGKFEGSYYRRNRNLNADVAAWVYEGIDDDRLGDFGLSGGGAAGYEVDRVDSQLGTPEQTHILATSENHQQHFVLVPEEHLTHLYTWPGESTENVDRLIRADMVYFETANNGGVFSVGSITWCGSLPENNYDNNIARLTGNVLRHFSSSS